MPISLRGTTPRGFGVETIELFRTRVARARTRRVTWQRFGGFVGERNEHEGRCVMLTTDGSRLQAPGTLDPDEMDPFWSQGGVSAVDQLNRLVAQVRPLTPVG